MANAISFEINAGSASISPNGRSSVTVYIEDAERSDLLNLFSAQQAIDHFSVRDILNEIDEDEVKRHFGIE